MPGADKLDCLQISYMHIIIFSFYGVEFYYHATIMVSYKQYLKCISVLVADGKKVAKRARQS